MHIIKAKKSETEYTVELKENEFNVILAALWHYYAVGGHTNGVTTEQAHYVYDSFSLERERINKS